MTNEDILKALLGFLLGLIAKFIYDLINEKRKRKSIALTKIIRGSFTRDTLDKELKDLVRVYFNALDVNSIHLVTVKIKNIGYASIKHQTFSVKFTNDAQIMGTPSLSGSNEDLQLIKIDENQQPNLRRFVLDVFQREREITIDFVVVNHDSPDFEVLHSIDSEIATSIDQTDLDVNVSFTGEKVDLNFISFVKQWIISALLLPIMYAVKVSLSDFGGTVGAVTSVSIWNIFIIFAWLNLLQITYRLLPLLIEWIESIKKGHQIYGDYIGGDKVGADKVGGDKISIGDILRASGIAVGNSASASNLQKAKEHDPINQAFTILFNQIDALLIPQTAKVAARQVIKELEHEALRNEKANEELISNWLVTLGDISKVLQSSALSIFKSPIDGLSPAFLIAAENPDFQNNLLNSPD